MPFFVSCSVCQTDGSSKHRGPLAECACARTCVLTTCMQRWHVCRTDRTPVRFFHSWTQVGWDYQSLLTSNQQQLKAQTITLDPAERSADTYGTSSVNWTGSDPADPASSALALVTAPCPVDPYFGTNSNKHGSVKNNRSRLHTPGPELKVFQKWGRHLTQMTRVSININVIIHKVQFGNV